MTSVLHDPFPSSPEPLPSDSMRGLLRGLGSLLLLGIAIIAGVRLFGSESVEEASSATHLCFILAAVGGLTLLVWLIVDRVSGRLRL